MLYMNYIMRSLLAFAFLLLGIALAAPLYGDIIELDFEGVITQSSFTSVDVGDTFTGSVFYSVPDTALGTTCAGPCISFYALPEAIQVNVDGSSIYSTNLATTDNDIAVSDSNGTSSGSAVTWLSGFYELGITGPLAGERSPAFDDLTVAFDGPSSVLSTTQLPEDFPSLSEWSDGALVNFGTFSGFGAADKSFEGDILSLTESVVTPEPSLFPLLLMGLVGVALISRRRQRSSHTQ
jgi:hypothetical protein